MTTADRSSRLKGLGTVLLGSLLFVVLVTALNWIAKSLFARAVASGIRAASHRRVDSLRLPKWEFSFWLFCSCAGAGAAQVSSTLMLAIRSGILTRSSTR